MQVLVGVKVFRDNVVATNPPQACPRAGLHSQAGATVVCVSVRHCAQTPAMLAAVRMAGFIFRAQPFPRRQDPS